MWKSGREALIGVTERNRDVRTREEIGRGEDKGKEGLQEGRDRWRAEDGTGRDGKGGGRSLPKVTEE